MNNPIKDIADPDVRQYADARAEVIDAIAKDVEADPLLRDDLDVVASFQMDAALLRRMVQALDRVTVALSPFAQTLDFIEKRGTAPGHENAPVQVPLRFLIAARDALATVRRP